MKEHQKGSKFGDRKIKTTPKNMIMKYIMTYVQFNWNFHSNSTSKKTSVHSEIAAKSI